MIHFKIIFPKIYIHNFSNYVENYNLEIDKNVERHFLSKPIKNSRKKIIYNVFIFKIIGVIFRNILSNIERRVEIGIIR